MTQLLTHSRLACFRTCPRAHYIRYELGLRPLRDDLPRRVGSAFHRALDLAARNEEVSAAALGLDDPYESALVAAMFSGHGYRWGAEPFDVVASEIAFELPLVNPDTGAATPVWRIAGRIDSIIRLPDGRLALLEYKTTSRDFSPGADYWQRLHLDQQLSIYVLAARALGHDVQTVLYDVTRRPALRPYKATPIADRKFTKTGSLYANQRAIDETPEEYAARLAADIAERQDHYFARIEIARLDRDLDDCRAELWQQQLALREAQRTNRWYRNAGACFSPVACDYLPVCLNRDLHQNTPTGYVRSDEIHPELGEAANEG